MRGRRNQRKLCLCCDCCVREQPRRSRFLRRCLLLLYARNTPTLFDWKLLGETYMWFLPFGTKAGHPVVFVGVDAGTATTYLQVSHHYYGSLWRSTKPRILSSCVRASFEYDLKDIVLIPGLCCRDSRCINRKWAAKGRTGSKEKRPAGARAVAPSNAVYT